MLLISINEVMALKEKSHLHPTPLGLGESTARSLPTISEQPQLLVSPRNLSGISSHFVFFV